MTVNTICMASSRNHGSVLWIKRLSKIHLTSSMTCKKGGADQRNIIIIELRRFGSRKRIIYCAKRTWVSTIELGWVFDVSFLLWQIKSTFSLPWTYGKFPWTIVGYLPHLSFWNQLLWKINFSLRIFWSANQPLIPSSHPIYNGVYV